MTRFGLWLALAALMATGLAVGRGARVAVVKENALARIDALLGNMEVKRKEIEMSVAGLKEGLQGLRKARIMAQVKEEQLGHQAEPIERELATMDSSLGLLRERLAAKMPLQTGGKVYEPDEVNNLATRLVTLRKERSERLDGLRTAASRLQHVGASLERKQTEYERRLTGIENQLAVVDSNRVALAAMREAAKSMEAGHRGLSANVALLEEKVNNLFAEVELELSTEDAQWRVNGSRRELDSVDSLLNAARPADDTIAEIDSILKTSVAAAESH